MSINAVYQPITIDYERACQPKQILLGCNMDTSSKGGVSKVFFVKSSAQITKVAAMSKQVKISGHVNIKVMYLTNQQECESFDYITDFVEDVECDDVTEDMPVRASAKVVDNEYQINGDQIKIQAVVELCPVFVESKSEQFIVSAEGALVKTRQSCRQNFISHVDREIELADEYDSGMDVDKVLFFDAAANVEDVTTAGEIVTVKGSADVDIIYRAEGKIVEKRMNIPFEEEWREKEQNLFAKVQACVKNSKLVLQGSQDSNVMRVELLCKLSGVVMSESCDDTVEDLFCPTAETNCQYTQCDFYRQAEPVHCHLSVIGSDSIDETAADVKQVLAAETVNCVIAEVTGGEDMSISGMAEVAVVYVDENDDIDCKYIEIPFLERCQYVLEKDAVTEWNAYVNDTSVKVKRDREFEVNLDVDVTLDIAPKTQIRGISALEEGEARPANNVAVSIYSTSKGETLWDIAKQLMVSDKEILAQNPGIGEVMEGDERLVVYRELKV
ncbi:MAG: SPOCS domain-containing protein [Christensenellales bacterium]